MERKKIEGIDKEAMKRNYVEMGIINRNISEEYMEVEGKEFLEMEVKI